MLGLLRQLRQINPFYRDSSELLAAAETEINRRSERAPLALSRPLLAFGAMLAVAQSSRPVSAHRPMANPSLAPSRGETNVTGAMRIFSFGVCRSLSGTMRHARNAPSTALART